MVKAFPQKLLLSISFGLFVYLFLVLFQPFEINNVANNNPWYILGFGLITSVVMLANYCFTPFLFPSFFNEDHWIAGKEVLFILSHLIIISFFNYYYNLKMGNSYSFHYTLSYFLFVTVAIGIFPISFYIFSTELLLTKQLTKNAQEINNKRIKNPLLKASPQSHIQIKSTSTNTFLEINIHDLVFIKSEGNYSKIYYLEAEELRYKLLRISLKNIQEQLISFEYIIRCHRSYIVNKRHITNISGNARSYLLHIQKHNDTIPVSRSFSKEQLA